MKYGFWGMIYTVGKFCLGFTNFFLKNRIWILSTKKFLDPVGGRNRIHNNMLVCILRSEYKKYTLFVCVRV
jgi:hypothetical protein